MHLVIWGVVRNVHKVRPVGTPAKRPSGGVPQQADQRLDGCDHLGRRGIEENL